MRRSRSLLIATSIAAAALLAWTPPALSSTEKTQRISVSSAGRQGNRNSSWPSISADGRLVAFYSGASNLVRRDTNHEIDIFVYDRKTHRTKRVSVSSAGRQGNGPSYDPSISANGRFIAFCSAASNLVAGDKNHRW